jgi:hypothetical protein
MMREHDRKPSNYTKSHSAPGVSAFTVRRPLLLGAGQSAPAKFRVTERPDAQWLRGWLVEGEQPIGEALEVVNLSQTEQLVPVPLGKADKLLVFDRDRAPLGYFPIARDEIGRALVHAKPNEPVFVFGVLGNERPESARPFMVRENAGRLSLRIGQLTEDQGYTVKLWFRPLGKPETLVTDIPLQTSAGGFLSFPTGSREPGTYRFEVQGADGKEIASKGVYSHGSRREDMKTVEAAARRYAPVFSQTPEEEQVPVSPEHMLGGVKPNESITFEQGEKKVSLPAEKLLDLLRFESSGTINPDFENTGLRRNGVWKKDAALSYRIVPDPDDRDMVHISYEFFYRFDPKSGTRHSPAFASHPFDAEGIIITMKRSGGEWKPTMVTYRHHVENQQLGMYGIEQEELHTDEKGGASLRSAQKIVHTWEHGAVKVPYDKTIQTPDGRPAVFLSKAHAPYPYPGRKGLGGYRVMVHRLAPGIDIPAKFFSPFEHAGGGRVYAPPEAHLPGALPYALKNREAAETTEGIASALSGKRGNLPVGSFSLAKTPEEIVSMYVRQAEPMATSRVAPEILQEGHRILKEGKDLGLGVPTWDTLPGPAKVALEPRGFKKEWFESSHDDVRMSVLNLYVKLKALGLWHFVERDAGSDSESLTFTCTDIHEFKRALRARGDFTSPEATSDSWESREYRTVGQIHFKHFEGWPENRVQSHIDGRGLLPSKPLFYGLAAGTAGLGLALQALAHRIERDSYKDPYAVRDILLQQKFDQATLKSR